MNRSRKVRKVPYQIRLPFALKDSLVMHLGSFWEFDLAAHHNMQIGQLVNCKTTMREIAIKY